MNERIKERREYFGLSQRELADAEQLRLVYIAALNLI